MWSWRKREDDPPFDPDLGEIPEHLEVYPPSDWRGRRILTTSGVWLVGILAVLSGQVLLGSMRRADNETIIFADRLSVICETRFVPADANYNTYDASVSDPLLTSERKNRPCTEDELKTSGAIVVKDGIEFRMFTDNLHLVQLLIVKGRSDFVVSTTLVDEDCFVLLNDMEASKALFGGTCNASRFTVP
ncbi:MAG: hypothetical protein AB7N24_18525 [Dehalococcoidia bacterium]